MRCFAVKMPATGCWVCAAAVLLAVGFGAMRSDPAPAAVPRRAADAGFAAWRGVSSCTSSACHDQDSGRGGRGGDAKGSEYAVWAGIDPHARAYQVLFDARP